MQAWRDSSWAGRGLLIALAVLGLFLAWSVAVEAASHVLARPTALALKPGSPRLLARQGEAALKAGQADAAVELSRRSLAASPFNVRGLRVLGIALAQQGQGVQAEQILTLAGNWSLRDTAAHLWLADERLRRADYGSGVAHLDAVMRRREDLRPRLFDLLGKAAVADPRALAVVSERLALKPNWREDFLTHLLRTSDGQVAAVTLAASLHAGGEGMTEDELSDVFNGLIRARRFQAVRQLAQVLGLRDAEGVADGGFEGVKRPAPLRWDVTGGSGATVEIVPSESGEGRLLRVEYDGYSSPSLVRQLLLLDPGSHRLSGRALVDGPADRLAWRIRCAETTETIAAFSSPEAAGEGWRDFDLGFTVPASRCDVQWLELAPQPGPRRVEILARYDDLTIR